MRPLQIDSTEPSDTGPPDTGPPEAYTKQPHQRRLTAGTIVRATITGLLFALAALIAWSADRGGPVSFAIVSGVSMEPTYHTGDLLFALRTPGRYLAGDAVVYEVNDGDLHGRVVHRIVKQLPNGNYLTQGDNKAHVDPWEVRPEWIHGQVVALVPQAYKVIMLLRTPWMLAILCGLLITIALWPQAAKSGRVSRQKQKAPPPEE